MVSRIKIAVMFVFIALIGVNLWFSSSFVVFAESDQIIAEIEGYKKWAKINKDPIRVDVILNLEGG